MMEIWQSKLEVEVTKEFYELNPYLNFEPFDSSPIFLRWKVPKITLSLSSSFDPLKLKDEVTIFFYRFIPYYFFKPRDSPLIFLRWKVNYLSHSCDSWWVGGACDQGYANRTLNGSPPGKNTPFKPERDILQLIF